MDIMYDLENMDQHLCAKKDGQYIRFVYKLFTA